MAVRDDTPHEVRIEAIKGGHRYSCALCDAVVGIPTVLEVQWNKEGRLAQEIQRELTRSLLLRTGHYR